MSSLEKCREYEALKRGLGHADKEGVRELISVAARGDEVSLLTTMRDQSAKPVLVYHLKHVLEKRMPELIAQALEHARDEAIQQADDVQRTANAALTRLRENNPLPPSVIAEIEHERERTNG